MKRRISVRKIASNMSHAWLARKTTVRMICDAPIVRSLSTPRKWLRLEIPRRLGLSPEKNGIRGGMAITTRMKAAHNHGALGAMSQLAISVRYAAGADNER